MSLSSIVNVTVSRQTSAPAQAGFGTGLILGSSGRITGDKVRTFSSIEAVEALFQSGDPELVAAGKYFGQEVKPTTLKIAQRDADVAQVNTVTVGTLQNNTLYRITINGVNFDFTSDADATTAEIEAGLTAAVNGGSEPVTAVDGTGVVLTADVAGDPFTITVSANLTNTATTANKNIQTELAAVVLEDNDWYCLISCSRVKKDITRAAEFIEARPKIYIAASTDSDIFTDATTDVVTALVAAAYDRTALIAKKGGVTDFPDAAWAGRQLPQDPGSSTWAFKTLAGVTVDSLNDSEIANAEGKGANLYLTVGGLNLTVGKNNGGIMASGEFIDVMIGVDYITARIAENVFAKLVNLEKVPFTDGGVLVIVEAVEFVLKGAIPDILSDSPAPAVTAPLVAAVSANDKAIRKLPDVEFTATLSGAIHKTEIQGVVTL